MCGLKLKLFSNLYNDITYFFTQKIRSLEIKCLRENASPELSEFRLVLGSLTCLYDSDQLSFSTLKQDITLTERFCQFLIRETTSEYFKWVNDKKMVDKHCRAVVDIWESKGYTIAK